MSPPARWIVIFLSFYLLSYLRSEGSSYVVLMMGGGGDGEIEKNIRDVSLHRDSLQWWMSELTGPKWFCHAVPMGEQTRSKSVSESQPTATYCRVTVQTFSLHTGKYMSTALLCVSYLDEPSLFDSLSLSVVKWFLKPLYQISTSSVTTTKSSSIESLCAWCLQSPMASPVPFPQGELSIKNASTSDNVRVSVCACVLRVHAATFPVC